MIFHWGRQLPIDALDAINEVEVVVAGEDGHCVLAGEGSDPDVVFGNFATPAFQVIFDFGVLIQRFVVWQEQRGGCNEIGQQPETCFRAI